MSFLLNWHISDIIWYLSLSNLLHLVWSSLGPSMLLQMALFHSFLWLSHIPLYICTTSSLSVHQDRLFFLKMEKRFLSDDFSSLFSIVLILFFLINLFYLFLFVAALGLRCCAQAFSSCSERGPLFVAVRGLLAAVAPPAAKHGLQARRLQ